MVRGLREDPGLSRVKILLLDSAKGEDAEVVATSVVFGMPKAALRCGATETALPLSRIAPWILGACRGTNRQAG